MVTASTKSGRHTGADPKQEDGAQLNTISRDVKPVLGIPIALAPAVALPGPVNFYPPLPPPLATATHCHDLTATNTPTGGAQGGEHHVVIDIEAAERVLKGKQATAGGDDPFEDCACSAETKCYAIIAIFIILLAFVGVIHELVKGSEDAQAGDNLYNP